MSKLIGIVIAFSPDLSPGTLLTRVLKSNFANFLFPKMGRVIVDNNTLHFGVKDSVGLEKQYPGEQIISPGITALPGYPDATREILTFLGQFPQATKCSAQFFGETLLDYMLDGSITRGGISRYGGERSYYAVTGCHLSPFRSTTFGLSIPCPMFFLKYWWPEDGFPRYSTPETAEHNWDALIDAVQSIIDVGGTSELQGTSLHLEGSTVNEEKDWLIAKAQRLPKLEVDFA